MMFLQLFSWNLWGESIYTRRDFWVIFTEHGLKKRLNIQIGQIYPILLLFCTEQSIWNFSFVL